MNWCPCATFCKKTFCVKKKIYIFFLVKKFQVVKSSANCRQCVNGPCVNRPCVKNMCGTLFWLQRTCTKKVEKQKKILCDAFWKKNNSMSTYSLKKKKILFLSEKIQSRKKLASSRQRVNGPCVKSKTCQKHVENTCRKKVQK